MWPLIILGALASYQAQRGARKRQETMQNAMQIYQQGQARKSQAAVEELIGHAGPEQRQQEMRALEGERAGEMQSAVDSMSRFAPTPTAGKLSDDRTRATSAAAADVAARTKRAIEQLSRMGAPGDAGLASAKRFGRAASSVKAANRAIGGARSAYDTDSAGVLPNPWLHMAGGVATNAGIGGIRGRARPIAPAADDGFLGP